MGRTRGDIVAAGAWWFILASAALFWSTVGALAVSIIKGATTPVPVSRSAVAESEPEPGLTIIGEGE